MFNRWLRRLTERVQRDTLTINAATDDVLLPVLEKHGLLEPLRLGKVRCPHTNEVLSLESMAGIVMRGGRPLPLSAQGMAEEFANQSPPDDRC